MIKKLRLRNKMKQNTLKVILVGVNIMENTKTTECSKGYLEDTDTFSIIPNI